MDHKENKISPDSIGRLIRAARKYSGLSQEEACQEMKITQGSLSKIENGVFFPRIDVWFKICDAYKIDPSCYYYGFIDSNLKKITNKKNKNLKGFKVDTKWLDNPSINSRMLLPLVKILQDKSPKQKFNKVFKELAIDPDIFFILEANFNTNLIDILLKKIKDLKLLTSKQVSKDLSKNLSFHSTSNESGIPTKKSLNSFIKNYQFHSTISYFNILKESKNEFLIKNSLKNQDEFTSIDSRSFFLNYSSNYLKENIQLNSLINLKIDFLDQTKEAQIFSLTSN